MEESRASQMDEATPIFGAYRRGYDPEQVDRYVAAQQQRLDESLRRAAEAERKLAAAVGQLRELHRRVGALEDQRRPSQTFTLDGVGEHIQRIFEEAREGGTRSVRGPKSSWRSSGEDGQRGPDDPRLGQQGPADRGRHRAAAARAARTS